MGIQRVGLREQELGSGIRRRGSDWTFVIPLCNESLWKYLKTACLAQLLTSAN